jgi:hypothetical protein
VTDRRLRLEMGERSESIIEGFTPRAWAAGFKEAVEATLGRAA